MLASAVLEDLPVSLAAPANRRTHARIPAAELAWIREVRLKYGPKVAVLDMSPGGVLLQTSIPLRPGSELAIEIVSHEIRTVPLRVLRSQIATFMDGNAVYRGACEFKRPIDLQLPAPAQALRVDLALKGLVEQRRRDLSGGAPSPALDVDRELPTLLRALQAATHGSDPLSRGFAVILTELLPAVERREPAPALRARLEDALRRMMPSLALSIGREPATASGPGRESIYFSAAGAPGSTGLLNVELREGTRMPNWQFRVLQAASYLLELLPAGDGALQRAEPVRAATTAEQVRRTQASDGAAVLEAPSAAVGGWQKIVVRYRDGRLLKGFTHDFHPSRTHFSLWPSLNAAPAERVHIPTSQLKGVFFVRDFDGNPERSDSRVFDHAPAGRRLEVTFGDDEVLVGSTLSYRPEGLGFFVIPADRGVNNLRVFVVSGAIRHVRFL
jgi:hypothetical protein